MIVLQDKRQPKRITSSGLLGRFRRAIGGNVAMIFGISVLPIMAAIGVAVDFSRAIVVRARLSQALDAAGLAVGGTPGLTGTQLQDLAEDFFNANYPVHEIGVPGELQVFITGDNVVTLRANARVDTTIMNILGYDHINVAAEAEITRETRRLEVALVLDNTGSMNGGDKIGALRNAATDLLEIVFGEQETPELLRVSLVPFVTAVNIRNEEFDMSWMDVNAQSTYHGENFLPDPDGNRVNHFDLFTDMGVEWKGCVEARPAPYNMNDAAPDPTNPDTLFVPYLWPDEPDTGDSNFHNKYMDDRLSDWPGDPLDDTLENRQANWAKYAGGGASVDETPSSTSGPNMSCATPVVPLTNERQRLMDAVADMRAWNNSGTNVAEGLAWGWRVLSPGEPFTTGLAFDDPEVQKALVLLTDGESQIWGGWSTFNKSNYASIGYLSALRLGTDSRHTAKGVINDQVAVMCDQLKQRDVRLYTITFAVNSTALHDLFRGCASEPELYFHSPTNEELDDVFQAIGQDLSNLRLSR